MRILYTLLVLLCCSTLTQAQKPQKPTSSEIYHNLQKLNFLGSAMYIAAHPDDENTRLISYLANDVKARTAYLSLTRGDGGQNLIGPEIRELLGVIRTQELIAARNTDGGQQLFTRANDFGYSKHPDETLAIWNKDKVLGDVVRAIRKFKPDIIVNRFNHRTPGTTHGHHTASAMLSVEAFDLVANDNKYPETAQEFGTWQPKRLFFNTSWWFYGSRENFEKADKSNILEIETGTYYKALGLSNGEIASLSRSMHKSQGFGSTGSRGSATEYLEFLKGDFETTTYKGNPDTNSDIFAGINTTWSRIEGGQQIENILKPLEKNFDFKNPAKMLPQLLQAHQLIMQLENKHWKEIKLQQIEQLILNCGGIFLEAAANTNSINPNGTYTVAVEAINRSSYPLVLQSVTTKYGSIISDEVLSLLPNEKIEIEAKITSKANKVSTPYWLNQKGSLGMYEAPSHLIGLPETPAPEQVVFSLQLGRNNIQITRDVVYKYNDPVDGEVYQPLEVIPEVTTSIPEKVLIFASDAPKQIPVIIKAGKANVEGFIKLNHPEGWEVSPDISTFNIEQKGQEKTILFTVTPPKGQSEGYLKPIADINGNAYDKELFIVDYKHIPFQRVLLPSEAKVVRIPIEKRGNRIGYIEGAGDAIPENLKQIGYDVQVINPSEITEKTLSEFDAVVVGIRAFNTVPELAFKNKILHKYTENGGTLVLQYNTSHRLVTKELAPYPITLSRDRVTDEFSEVSLLAPKHPVLNEPNKITKADFESWVQERGLYFPNKWDDNFTPILGMNDKNYPETKGSLLVAKHGKGYFVYTGLSFFRELPAGVPGAYRLFANILSLGN